MNNKSRSSSKRRVPRNDSLFTRRFEGYSLKFLKGIESKYLRSNLGIKLLSLRVEGNKSLSFLGDKTVKFLCKFTHFLTITNPTICFESYIYEYIKWFTDIELTNGKTEACKIAKSVAGVHLRHAAGHTFDAVPYMKVNDRGLPIKLTFILPFIEGTIPQKRAGLCILDLYKLIASNDPTYDVKSIVGYPEVPMQEPSLNMNSYLERVCVKRGISEDPLIKSLLKSWKFVLRDNFPVSRIPERIQEISKLSKIHVSAKSGPNGPALLTIKVDYDAIKETPILQGVRWFADVLNIEYLKRLLDSFALEDSSAINSKGIEPITSRICLKQEAGGKNRLFAIGDYFTQCALKGFHKWCFNWLHSRKEDGTSSHDRVAQVAKQMSLDIDAADLISSDLRKATDTIPVEAQGEIACAIGGEAFAQQWVNLLVNRDFTGPDGEKDLRYNTGQPMGILSSWAMMAIWNHLVTLTCFHTLGLPYDPDKTEYLVIGDDKADALKEVAKLYQLMLGLFGVEVSPLKGYEYATLSDKSLPLNGKSTIEIAKRVFLNGQELTPVSPVLIQQSFTDTDAFPNLLREMDRRGYCFDEPPALPLSKLCIRAKLAIHIATFPSLVAPLTGITFDDGGDVIVPENLKGLVWFSDIPNSITKATSLFKTSLKKRLNESLSELYQTLNEYLALSVSGEPLIVKDWEIKSCSQLGVYKLVYDECHDKVYRIMTTIDNKLDAKSYFSNDKSDPVGLQALIGKLKITFDLEKLLKGDDPDYRDEKDFSAGMIATTISEMLQ